MAGGYKIAVAGATGNVGREMLKTLAERDFPVREVVALASSRSVGKEVSYGEDKILKVRNLETYDFSDTDIALFSAGSKPAEVHGARAAAQGCVVIDNSSFWRMHEDVPLVVPEVNPEAIADYARRNIIANPNCSTIQMVVALKPLHDVAGIKRVVVSTYQSTSGAGKAAMDELFNQTKGIYVNDPIRKEHFSKQIAFNVIPQIDIFMEGGITKEEWKMMVETQKLLDPAIAVSATCVRVPTFIGHAEAVNIEFDSPLSAKKARAILRESPGISVIDHVVEEGYVTPAECAGEDSVFISRIREDHTLDHGLNIWVVADNLRKGAALNAVQIAEELVANYLDEKTAQA